MAKGVNKTQAILAYCAAHPAAANLEVVEALHKQGIKVSRQTVATTKSKAKHHKLTKSSAARARSAAADGESMPIGQMVKVLHLAKDIGADNLKKLAAAMPN